jgi:hypothetical protein
MFYLYGSEFCVKTIFLLASTIKYKPIQSVSDLKENYLLFLKNICANCLPNQSTDSDQFCFNTERIKTMAMKYEDDGILTDLKSHIDLDTPLSSMREALNRVQQGKSLITKINPSLTEILDLTIHTLFYSRSAYSGGGSVSDAPGVIWCSVRRNWTDIDIAEFLVHELTHNLVFLDELCYQHYSDLSAIADEKNYAKSTILNKQRPLDKTFHSLVVAHEVLSYRKEAGESEDPRVHPNSAKMLASCKETISSINSVIDNNSLVTPRFREILSKVEGSLKQLETSFIPSVSVAV